jgi:hypothetical protein
MMRYPLLLISAVMVFSCATTGLKTELEEMIMPKRSYEECVELHTGETLAYYFTSSRPLDFNIHYHAEDGVKYPVNVKNVKSHRGNLVINEQKYYTEDQEAFCMMWKNNDEAFVNLKLKYRVISDK